MGIWWWNCYCGAYNDYRRTNEIASALKIVDFKQLVEIYKAKNKDDEYIDGLYEWLASCFEELKNFYIDCSKYNYAVWANFG